MTLNELDIHIDIEITEQQMRTYEVIIISTPQGEIEYELSPQTRLNKIYRFIGKGNRIVSNNIADEVGDFCVRFILKKDYALNKFNVKNLIIWLIGFVLYRFLMKTDMVIGYTFPAMIITSLICVICEKIKVGK